MWDNCHINFLESFAWKVCPFLIVKLMVGRSISLTAHQANLTADLFT